MNLNKLYEWYVAHKRQLPWRESRDPYYIWLSEVILQQTQVAQGLPYYTRFVEAYPTVEALANANDDDVMKLWQGLGYYSRARNALKAARFVRDACNGVFPSKYIELKKLPGVGPYTAAAVASIAFEEPVAVVDGNVIRVVSRLFQISEPVDQPRVLKQINELATTLLDEGAPSQHNQAMMELGALVCKPTNPQCHHCPLNPQCAAHRTGVETQIPIKSKKIKKTNRWFHFIIVLDDRGHTLIEQRTGGGIWQNLFQFPLIEAPSEMKQPDLKQMLKTIGMKQGALVQSIPVKKHVLTHQNLHSVFHVIRTTKFEADSNRKRVSVSQLEQYAFPRLIDRFLEAYVSRLV